MWFMVLSYMAAADKPEDIFRKEFELFAVSIRLCRATGGPAIGDFL